MSSNGGEVILFPRIRDDAVTPPAEVKDSRRSYEPGTCRHDRNRLHLDIEAHQLVCPDCKQVLDPFDWIVKYVNEWARHNTGYRQAVQQEKELRHRVDKLQKLETRVKARIRGAGILLTSGEARKARDQLRAMHSALISAVGDREKAIRMAHLHGFRKDDVAVAFNALDRQLELRDPPEEQSA